jgi:DNA-binding transcriptional ArsR family regulator
MSRAFDFDPKDLELPPEIAAKAKRDTAAAAPRARISGIKRKDAFAIIPLWWARLANEAGHVNLLVCVDLVYRAWRVRDGSKTFVMPNSKGMDPKTKMRTLDVLEKAGLISVNRRDRKSPVVTLTISIF